MPQPDWSRTLLDPAAMRAHLAAALPGWHDAGGTLRLHQSRRRISRRTEEEGALYLGVAYEWAEPSTAPGCYLRAYSRGISAAVAASTGGIHLPALDAVAYPLPHDPTLRALPRFLDASGVAEALPAWAAALASPRIVRYEPESHCTARVALREAGGGSRVAYGKCYADERWRAQAALLLALWPHGETHHDAFAVARPLGAYAGFGALWTEARNGAPLRDALARRETEAARWIARVVRGLQRLQALPPLARTPLDPPALLVRSRKQAGKLARADATLRAGLDLLLERLTQTLPRTTAPVNVHGDFHVDQMLAGDDGRVVLFDFDNLALGDPAHDVADCASQLLCDERFDATQRGALARALVAGATDGFGRSLARTHLDWHLRALLLRKAYSFFVRHAVDWRARVAHALALAGCGLQALDDACGAAKPSTGATA